MSLEDAGRAENVTLYESIAVTTGNKRKNLATMLARTTKTGLI